MACVWGGAICLFNQWQDCFCSKTNNIFANSFGEANGVEIAHFTFKKPMMITDAMVTEMLMIPLESWWLYAERTNGSQITFLIILVFAVVCWEDTGKCTWRHKQERWRIITGGGTSIINLCLQWALNYIFTSVLHHC